MRKKWFFTITADERVVLMLIQDFIGKIVIRKCDGSRYRIYEITSPTIEVTAVKPNENGYCYHLRYHTINGDPFSTGDLVFENESLLSPFLSAYNAHCLSDVGRMEEYGFWLRRE